MTTATMTEINNTNHSGNNDNQQPAIISTLVPENRRMKFFEKFVGVRDALLVEYSIFDTMSHICPDYDGGYWEFYSLNNGGYYTAPRMKDKVQITIDSNGYYGQLTPDAAGIVATLFVLNTFANKMRGEQYIELFYALRYYALQHAEADQILSAID